MNKWNKGLLFLFTIPVGLPSGSPGLPPKSGIIRILWVWRTAAHSPPGHSVFLWSTLILGCGGRQPPGGLLQSPRPGVHTAPSHIVLGSVCDAKKRSEGYRSCGFCLGLSSLRSPLRGGQLPCVGPFSSWRGLGGEEGRPPTNSHVRVSLEMSFPNWAFRWLQSHSIA